MQSLYSIQLAIPLYQVAMLLGFTVLCHIFGRVRIALVFVYLFALYWIYWLNRLAVLGKGTPALDIFTLCYFGFGILIVVLALIGFLNRAD